MREGSIVGLAFCCFCFVLLPSVEAFNWTVVPDNPVKLQRGEVGSLTWSYSLSAQEHSDSLTYISFTWLKFNYSISSYTGIATFFKIGGTPAYSEPNRPRIVVDRASGDNSVTLLIKDAREDDEGAYRIELRFMIRGPVVDYHTVNLTVLVPPEVVFVSKDTDICEGSNVTLSCNATGVPPPSITWTRVADDGKDSAPLQTIGGDYILESISRSSNGTYRCSASNPVGSVNRTVQVVIRYLPSVDEIRNSSITVTEGGYFNMTCEASGGPENYTWIRIDRGKQVRNEAVLIFNNINRNDGGQYRCETKNRCGNGSMVQSVDVYYPPTINTYIPSTLEKNDTEEVNLPCEADSNPPAQITWIRLSNNAVVPMPFNISGRQDEGYYNCTANNGVGSTDTRRVFISVLNYRPFRASLVTAKNPVALNETFSLNCSADAQPTAKYRLYREEDSLINTTVGNSFVTHLTTANKRKREMIFRCTPFNEYGDGPTERITVIVHFSPRIILKEKHCVERGENAYLHCRVEAYPSPTILWVPCNAQERVCDSSFLNISNVQTQRAYYTCTATNERGQDSETTTLVIGGNNTYISMAIITDEKCTEGASWRKQIIEEMDETFANINGYCGAKELNCRLGSVIVDLGLTFSVPVKEDFVISTIQSAIQDGKLGELSVNASSIIGILPVITSTAAPPTSTTTPKSGGSDCEESFFKDTSCSIKLEVAVGISVPAVGLIVMTAAAVGYWIHKKRKCRKDTRIAHEPGCEEQRLRGDDPYAQVNNGYAETGPRSVNSREKGAAAVPDYAVVDKSAKKKKKKQDEEKPPEYAVVDKSKKTKKNEKGDDTYAKVDMSKKTSKKKRKPGEEMLYADLGDFSGASQMPTVATSPKAQAQLPPIKRPESYEGTQYADITQFLKGDATLPIDDKQGGQQGAELKEKEGKTDGAGGENAPKETPM